MNGRRFIASAALAAMTLAPACTSRDDKAAAAAAVAQDALQSGDLATARRQIGTALAARDDISDYWLLSAHIALAEGSYGGAFDAYETLLSLDHGNAEALTRLCQISLSADQPQRAERYADQLALLHPGDKAATTVKAALAIQNGDRQTAARLLDQVLATDPADALAQIVRSKLLMIDEDYKGAAQAAEASLAAPGDAAGRLNVLKGIYLKAQDVEGYRRTVARLARAYPDQTAAQLDYARILYDSGDAAGGLAIAARILSRDGDSAAPASAVLNLWNAQGTSAMPAGAIVPNGAKGSLPAKAAYAQYANAIGRPDLALQLLGDTAAQEPANAANADVKAARAQARAQLGASGLANAEIAAVLAADGDQPRALAARASVRAKGGDRQGAIEDLRHALAGDPDNATARLTLAQLQLAQGDAVLATATLQEGLSRPSPDPRVASRLAALLRSQGRGAQAAEVIKTFAREHPFGRQPRA